MIRVLKMIPGGQSMGVLDDGRKIFFWNALPGEDVVEYRITKKKSHYVEAAAEKIEKPSKYRVKPKDDCYLSTSPWQIMDYGYELQQKVELVREVFRQQKIEIDTEILTDGQEYSYRNKMEYALYYDKEFEKIRLAFHERGSHRKVPIETSSIERSEILTKALQIVDDLNARGEEARKYQSLLLRCNQKGEVSGGLFENGKPHPVFENLTDEILSIPYSYSPNGFFQINLPVYEMALLEIKKYIETDTVLDLYAGVGTIGLSVARDKKLTLVENNKAAYCELVSNASGGRSSGPSSRASSLSPRRNCGFPPKTLLTNSEDALDCIEPDETVIVDPPRAGCDKKLIEKFLEVKPRRIIYLSCNPATQARDIEMLLGKYIIKSIKTFNFFPRTPHIENLVVLDISPDE